MNTERRSEDRPVVSTILVVDDSTAIRRIIGRTLTEAGYSVVEAENGLAALAACRAERPDLVLLDVDMPVMDGLTTLREMRADPELQDLPVLFLTARTGGADVAAGLALGAEDYLRKPCEPAELTARVARTLRAKAQEVALARLAREMNELSTTDVLTGLGNRRRMEATIQHLLARHGPEGVVAVIMYDVDHFKAVNDTFGHLVGDVVLRIVAGRLRGAVDDRVVLARWGGEEFLMAGVGLDRAETIALAERAREVVGASGFATGVDQTIPVTVSAGCAIGTLAAFADALEAADGALYEAKRTGRDRVVMGRDRTDPPARRGSVDPGIGPVHETC
jgi:two-component system, cell cycle response regulator